MTAHAATKCKTAELRRCEIHWYGEFLAHVDCARSTGGPVVDANDGAGVDARLLHAAVETLELDCEALGHGVAGADQDEGAGFVAVGVGEEV